MARVLLSLTAAFIVFASIAPFINPYRVLPSGAFHSEALAAVGVLLAMVSSAMLIERRARIDFTLAIGAAVLALLIGLQVVRGQHDYVMTWTAWLCMLALFVLASTWGQLVAQSADLQEVVLSRLAWGFVIAAVATVVMQALQLAGVEGSAGGFTMSGKLTGGCRPAGNVGQPNHANTVMWMGIGALWYLRQQGRLRLAFALPLLALLLLGSAITGSRTTWVFVAIVVAFAIWRSRDGNSLRRRPLLLALALASATVVAALVAGQLIGAQCDSSLARFTSANEEKFNSLRWELTRQAINVWLAHPIGGAGVGRLYAATFFNETHLDQPHRLDLFAHNIVLDFLASTGLAGLLIVAVTAWVWLSRVRRTWQGRPYELMGASWIAILLAHSLLEQPLVHAYFLIPFGIVAGVLLAPHTPLGSSLRFTRAALAAGALAGLAFTAAAVLDYHRLAHLMTTARIAQNTGAQESPLTTARLVELRSGIWLHAPYADAVVYGFELPSSGNIKDMRLRTQKLLRVFPNSGIVTRAILVATFDGDATQAQDLLRRLQSFYPDDAREVRAKLLEAAEKQPEYAQVKTYLEAVPFAR